MNNGWLTISFNCGSILKNLLLIITILAGGWHLWGLYKLNKFDNEIFNLKDEINNLDEKVLNKTRDYLVNQSQYEKIVAKEKEPLLKKLDTLKLKREYFLDKFPLISFFKK